MIEDKSFTYVKIPDEFLNEELLEIYKDGIIAIPVYFTYFYCTEGGQMFREMYDYMIADNIADYDNQEELDLVLRIVDFYKKKDDFFILEGDCCEYNKCGI